MPVSVLHNLLWNRRKVYCLCSFVYFNMLPGIHSPCFQQECEQSPATPNGLRKLPGVCSAIPYSWLFFCFFFSNFCIPLTAFICLPQQDVDQLLQWSCSFVDTLFANNVGIENMVLPFKCILISELSIKRLWLRKMVPRNPLVAKEGPDNSKKRKDSPQSVNGLGFKSAFVNWLLKTQTFFHWYANIHCLLFLRPVISQKPP